MRSARVELILDTLKAVRGAKDLSKATDDVSKSLDGTAAAGKAAGRAVDDAGDEMSESARAAAKLDREIEKLTGSLQKMAIAQALTGENFGKQMREQETSVRRLTRNRKLLGDFDKAGADSAVDFSASFSQKLGPLLAKLPVSGPMALGLGAAALTVAPLLGATISAAVIGGAGIGGVLGGLAVASKDTRVQAAGKQLADGLQTRLERAAGSFVQPAIAGVHEIQRSLDTIDIERIFRDSSKFVAPLSQGLGDAIESIGNAVEKLVANAGPVIAVISSGIAGIGQHLGDGLASLSDNSDEAASALTTVFGVINSGIDVTFRLVDVLSELYGWGQKIGADMGLKLILKATGAAMDENSASAEGLSASLEETTVKSAELEKQQELLKTRQDAVKDAQTGLKLSLESLGGATSVQSQRAAALKTAMDNLFGAAIRNTDANEAYEASWDSLSGAVSANGRSLSANTKQGRANRDALEGLLASSGELYLADIAAGVATDIATGKHQKRIAAVKEEARRLHLNKDATQTLINTYGRIPPRKTTDLILGAVDRVADALLDLAAIQLHLAKGTPLPGSLQRRLARAQYGMPDTKRAYGGPLPGRAPHDRADNMVYSGTPGEWVIQRPTVRKVEGQYGSGAMNYFNKYGELPGFATGGLLRASRASWGGSGMDFRVTAGMTKIPTLQRVIAAVPLMLGGNWPSSPAAQRGDSGVWRSIVRMINATGPLSGSFGNGYRPGDPKWHGSGRAVDWMGFNQDRLASFLAARRPLELIHRTRTRDYAYTRGVNKGSFNNALMEAHRNHVHIAMANGGLLREPVFGYGMRSGNTYSLAERGPERVLSAAQTAAGAGATYVLHATFSGPVGSQQQLDNWLTTSFARLKSRNRV